MVNGTSVLKRNARRIPRAQIVEYVLKAKSSAYNVRMDTNLTKTLVKTLGFVSRVQIPPSTTQNLQPMPRTLPKLGLKTAQRQEETPQLLSAA